MKELGKGLQDFQIKKAGIPYKFGINAGYFQNANKIITPDKHLQTSIFHEMGHAMNNNGGKILKGLQKMRPLAYAAPAYILLISMLNKRRTDEAQKPDDSKLQRGADFVKRNAGKLAALSFAPMVLEEGLASLRGQSLAKSLVKSGDLTKQVYGKIKTTNAFGFATYALGMISAGITAKMIVNEQDILRTKRENFKKDFKSKLNSFFKPKADKAEKENAKTNKADKKTSKSK